MNPATDGTVKVAVDYVRDILVHELDLENERIAIWDQKWKIPKDDGMFIVLQYAGAPIMTSSRIKQVEVDGDFIDKQDINTQEMIKISVCSRNLDALRTHMRVAFALVGTYSQQIQELNSFQIMRIMPVEDLRELEGAGMLYRFEFSVRVNAWYHYEKAIDFYSSFTTRVRDDEGIVITFDPTEDPIPET